MAKVLVLGSSGMAGHVSALVLRSAGHDVWGLQRSRDVLGLPIFQGDALSFDWLRGILNAGHFDSIVNCVGILNRGAEQDPAMTVLTNSYLPRWLAREARVTGAQLVHVSTDCVFSGRRGNYGEMDARDATDLYGASKSLGEVCEDAVTLRTSIIGPELTTSGSGLLNWLLTQRGEVSGFTRSIWGGVTTMELARTIGWVVRNPSTVGIFHVSNGEPISKHDLLKIVIEEMNLPLMITAKHGAISDKSLQTSRSPDLPVIPTYRAMIRTMVRWMRDHPEVYRHYHRTIQTLPTDS